MQFEELIFIGISVVIFIIVFFYLDKKGIIKTQTKLFYTYRKKSNRLNVSYKKYDGYDYYRFRLKKGRKVTIFYEIIVEEGSLFLEWRDLKDSFFLKEFHQSESGQFSFETTRSLHSLKLDGKNTRGGCLFEVKYE